MLDRVALAAVLFIVIPAACLMLAFFGLTICRLAARSDAADAVALGELIAATQPAHAVVPPPSAATHRYDPPDEGYRATG
jgi:hypothetical protein